MRDDLVAIYQAATLMEAQLLSDRLAEEGIDSFIDKSDSPLDGLTAAQQAPTVCVLPAQETPARRILAEFNAEAGLSGETGEEDSPADLDMDSLLSDEESDKE